MRDYHFIEHDLSVDPSLWIAQEIADIEALLARHAEFVRLYPEE